MSATHSVDEKPSPTGTLTGLTDVSYDSELAKKQVDASQVLRKLDLRLLPFVSLLYLLSFL